MADILKQKYNQNENIIDRVSSHMLIKKDAEDFMQLVSDIYQRGFADAVDGYKEQLAKLGYKVKIDYSGGK